MYWRVVAVFGLAWACSTGAIAGPWIDPGDAVLRHDIRVLADAGIIQRPTLAWPLGWGGISEDLDARGRADNLNMAEYAAMGRVSRRRSEETEPEVVRIAAEAALVDKPSTLRGFQALPRGEQQASASAEWIGDRFAARIEATAANDDPIDDKEYRLDGSYAAVAIGNWMLSVGSLDRWWGPGWDSSLVLSSSARPIPAISLQRNFSERFENKWLRWIGPWTMTLIWGQLEDSRAVPNARFFGWQVGFRPMQGLEISLERTAQWCGSGRPCGFDTFTDLVLGRDNQGDEGVLRSQEPGNQLAGFSARWASPVGSAPYALYMQLTGEDEAGDLPSKFLGLFGAEVWGRWGDKLDYRAYLEVADTTCSFFDRPGEFDCAYNNGLYPTGYRYRGRSIGHTADQDARVATLGLIAIPESGNDWQGVARYAELNRGGTPTAGNAITRTPKTIISLDVSHRRTLRIGQLELGVGVERMKDEVSAQSDTDFRAFLRLRRKL